MNSILILLSLEKTEIVFKIIEAGITSLALIAAGIWAYFRFNRQRENYPWIDFNVDISFIRKKEDWWIVELIAYVENKGKVQHIIKEFEFELASLNLADKVETSPEFRNQVYFPNKISKGSFLPANCSYFFIEPGLKNKYSYVARIPINAEVIILHSKFNYEDGKHFHMAEITVKVPEKDL